MTILTLNATNAAVVSHDLGAMSARVAVQVPAIVLHFGQLYQTRVRAAASGRPGPRVITGDYRRSISLEVVGPGTVAVGTDAPQGRRLELGYHDTDSRGRAYCVDDETEILTAQGWRPRTSLAVGDEVLTLNPDRWVAEWQSISALSVFPGPHEALLIEGRTLSALTTVDHRWLIERYYGRQSRWVRDWRTTATMPTNARIPLVQKCGDMPTIKRHSDDIVELVAWFWTEGCYGWSMQRQGAEARSSTGRPISLSIAQSERVNPANCERIRRLLSRLFGEPGPYADGAHWHSRVSPQSGSTNFRLDRVACWLVENLVEWPSKALQPSFLRELTQEQLDLLIDVSLLADGHTDQAGTTRLSQASEERIRSFEMACVLAGRPVVTRHRETEHYERWETTLLRSAYSHAFGSALRTDRDVCSLRPVRHDGVMWCPTTPNGTWLARRRGTVYFTGNSQPPFPHFEPPLDPTAQEMAAALDALVALDAA